MSVTCLHLVRFYPHFDAMQSVNCFIMSTWVLGDPIALPIDIFLATSIIRVYGRQVNTFIAIKDDDDGKRLITSASALVVVALLALFL